jgi:hypothetical protein
MWEACTSDKSKLTFLHNNGDRQRHRRYCKNYPFLYHLALTLILLQKQAPIVLASYEHPPAYAYPHNDASQGKLVTFDYDFLLSQFRSTRKCVAETYDETISRATYDLQLRKPSYGTTCRFLASSRPSRNDLLASWVTCASNTLWSSG